MKDTPTPQGTAYYGLLPVAGTHKIGVMVDMVSTSDRPVGTAYFGTTGDGNLSKVKQSSFNGYADSGLITTTLEYEDGPAPLTFSINLNYYQAAPTVAPMVSTPTPAKAAPPAVSAPTATAAPTSIVVNAYLYVQTFRVGKIPDTGETFLISDNVGFGLFTTSDSVIFQDTDGNGVISSRTRGEVQFVRNVLLLGAKQGWKLVTVSASGRTVKLSPVAKGTLKGRVQTFVGAKPIAGATIQIWPGPFETTSGQDGSYSLEAYGVAPWKVLVKKEGYVPYYSSIESKEKGSDSSSSVLLIENRTTTFDFELGDALPQTSGTVKLLLNGSFYAILGLAFNDQTVGDFYVYAYQQRDKDGKIVAFVQACSGFEGQRGMVGLGDRGSTPLDQITIPPIGYSNNCISLNVDHVYIAKAREGLEGHFVAFRVTSISTDGAATIDYLYR